MFIWVKLGCLLALAGTAGATTLQKLGFDEMIQQASGIVRAKVGSSYAAVRGRNIYTYYRLNVLESFKTDGNGNPEAVAIPGGSAGGHREVVPGAPELKQGEEYVVFYWTSPSGLTQVLGLSQGLFSERSDAPGNPVLVRPATTEAMVGKDGNPVQDQPLSLRLSDLRARVRTVLGVRK